MPEVLVVLSPSASADERAAVQRAAAVTQAISDRVFVATAADADALRRLPGVVQILSGTESPDGLPPLDDPAEALFARAWLAGRAPKTRTGDGLDWDTPPMRPPDRPRDR